MPVSKQCEYLQQVSVQRREKLRSAVGGLRALSIFQQLSWVIAMSRKVWSHQLRGSSIQWQESVLAFTSSVQKWIFPPFSYSPHTILLIKNWVAVEQTHKAQSLWYASKKSKRVSKQAQMSYHKQHSLSSRLCRIGNVISLIYLYFCTILQQNKHLHLSRD